MTHSGSEAEWNNIAADEKYEEIVQLLNLLSPDLAQLKLKLQQDKRKQIAGLLYKASWQDIKHRDLFSCWHTAQNNSLCQGF